MWSNGRMTEKLQNVKSKRLAPDCEVQVELLCAAAMDANSNTDSTLHTSIFLNFLFLQWTTGVKLRNCGGQLQFSMFLKVAQYLPKVRSVFWFELATPSNQFCNVLWCGRRCCWLEFQMTHFGCYFQTSFVTKQSCILSRKKDLISTRISKKRISPFEKTSISRTPNDQESLLKEYCLSLMHSGAFKQNDKSVHNTWSKRWKETTSHFRGPILLQESTGLAMDSKKKDILLTSVSCRCQHLAWFWQNQLNPGLNWQKKKHETELQSEILASSVSVSRIFRAAMSVPILIHFIQ